MRGVLAMLALCAGCDYVLRLDRVGDVSSDARGDAVDAPVVPFEFVQSNWGTAVSGTSTIVELKNEQTEGNLNVVIVGWTDVAVSVAVVDDSHNVYQVAQAAKTQNNIGQAIYYAENVVGGSNKVTVTYGGETAMYPDVRILEYAGPPREGAFLGGNTKIGADVTMSSNPLDVTAPRALLVAGFTVGATTVGPGLGYTERITTDHGDFVEDQVVAAAGTYSATALQSGATTYIVQLVAFALP